MGEIDYMRSPCPVLGSSWFEAVAAALAKLFRLAAMHMRVYGPWSASGLPLKMLRISAKEVGGLKVTLGVYSRGSTR